MHHALWKGVRGAVLSVLLLIFWVGSSTAASFCTELKEVVASSSDLSILKGPSVGPDRWEAKKKLSEFASCEVKPYRNGLIYSCETARDTARPAAEKKFEGLKNQLTGCLGNWASRGGGERGLFLVNPIGEAVELRLKEVAGFKREGDQMKTFPTWSTYMAVFPRRGSK